MLYCVKDCLAVMLKHLSLREPFFSFHALHFMIRSFVILLFSSLSVNLNLLREFSTDSVCSS